MLVASPLARYLKKLTKIALAHFAWPFIVGTTMIPQQSLTKNIVWGPRAGFIYVNIFVRMLFKTSVDTLDGTPCGLPMDLVVIKQIKQRSIPW